MKKKRRMLIPGVIFTAYMLVVATDCGRLHSADTAVKPLITLQSEESEFRKRYTGLGYTVQYYGDDEVNGAEFRFLDTILVWGWQI